MAAPYTLTLREAEGRLRELVAQAQDTFHPVVLVSEETTAPVALLSPLRGGLFERADSLSHHRGVLEGILRAWQQSLDEPSAQAEYATLFHHQLRLLSRSLSSKDSALGALVMLMRLAVSRLSATATPEQLGALRYGVESINPAVTYDRVRLVDERLQSSGLNARADFADEELLGLYVYAPNE